MDQTSVEHCFRCIQHVFMRTQGTAEESDLHLDRTLEDYEWVDLLGLKCPEPLMVLRQAIRGSKRGQRIIAVSTDPSTVRDFERYCRFSGHELLVSTQTEVEDIAHALYLFLIKKTY